MMGATRFPDEPVKAREPFSPDGTYVRLRPIRNRPASQAQLFFRQNSTLASRLPSVPTSNTIHPFNSSQVKRRPSK